MPNLFFPEGMGVYTIVMEIPEGGGGGYFSGQKMGIPWRRGWGLREIPFVVGVWIFSGTAQYVETYSKSYNTCVGVPIDFQNF